MLVCFMFQLRNSLCSTLCNVYAADVQSAMQYEVKITCTTMREAYAVAVQHDI